MRLRRPKHGTIVAYAALFIALGGVSYAAATLPSNSVGNAQLKANAVTGSKVKNRSLSSSDLKFGTLRRGATGATGAAGAGLSTFALVSATGTIDPATASGLTTANVSNPAQGAYCISGLATTPKNVQVNAVSSSLGPLATDAQLGPGVGTGCLPTTQVSVRIWASNNSTVSTSFFVVII